MTAGKISWVVFLLLLVLAYVFFTRTALNLPGLVASHFDATGRADAFMTHTRYMRFIVGAGIGLPIATVALLTWVYSRARDMKLPNREYWLSPEQIAHTRAILVAHGVWFGSLLVLMACFAHWMELKAHRLIPPQLSNPLFNTGLLVFFLVTCGWIFMILRIFRRPPALRAERPSE